MPRVCLECATPKLPMTQYCHVCHDKTLTHVGTERDPLCHRCKEFRVGKCYYTSDPEVAVPMRILNRAPHALTRFYHDCGMFRANNYVSQKPSPNPLSVAERQRIRAFRELPLSFWLDPALDDRDPHREDFWGDAPQTASLPIALALIAAALMASKIKVSEDS